MYYNIWMYYKQGLIMKHLRVLVVEDENFQRHMVLRILKSLGISEVYDAPDGIQGLALLKQHHQHIDLLICDLEMPGMDGMELLRHVSENNMKITAIIASGLNPALVSSIEPMALAYGIPILGIIEKPITKLKLEELLEKYYSTDEGKTSVQLKMDNHAFSKNEIIEGLKNEEFEPFFQPQVDMVSAFLKGAEALARWRHPQKGIIMPKDFISQMEHEGLIDDLMWIMLKKTARYGHAWAKLGVDLTLNLSVNLSLKSLVDPNLAERIFECVTAEGMDPYRMILEITESASATNLAPALENLSRLRMKGFGLSIDDYGTGYSSMQQLMRIAYTELKIDQSFVTDSASHESARVILSSSIDMAKHMGITSVAEGIESQKDWEYLRNLGCDLAQGYYIAKPIPADAFFDWAQEWNNKGFERLLKLNQ